MYFVDSQRTLTRRDSSLLTPKYGTAFDETAEDYNILTPYGAESTNLFYNESVNSFNIHKEPAQKEIVTILYDSMLKYIVESWTVIKEPKRDAIIGDMGLKTQSVISHKRKKVSSGDNKGNLEGKTKAKKVRSRQDILDLPQLSSVSNSMIQTWKTFPDERAVIRFKNGNIYEGSISMKCMHGEGRLQWANGTIYIGKFKENTICGRGKIFWNDDTWYEGEFLDNMRHGRGLFVDSRKQMCYYGGWIRGLKQGNGVMYYDGTFQNFYDGEWDNNMRHGYGCRQYSAFSGYKGYWHKDVIDGEGLMIWPNKDVYKGQWDNGDIFGKGTYIWEADFNNTITAGSVVSYKGDWKLGQRCGYGLLELGLDGARYEGEFANNQKHGGGMFVTNNGKILKSKHLFVDDNFGSMENTICETTVDLLCHVKQVLHDLKDEDEPRNVIISNYFRNNKIKLNSELQIRKAPRNDLNIIIKHEEDALKKAIDNYWTQIQNIYFMYANIDNDNITFKPVLIRLYLWKLYFNCSLNEKDLTLAEIDNLFHANSSWLSKNAHDPFERIYFWQFIHSLITVALKIYPVRSLSPNNHEMIGKSFRSFMENDILPRIGEHKGVVTSASFRVLPLQSIYKLFSSLGETVTLRSFLRAVRYPAHEGDRQPPLVDGEYIGGHNLYGLGRTLQFVADKETPIDYMNTTKNNLKLFNFGNLSSTTIITNIFATIFPQIVQEKILNLDKEIIFFEFLNLILLCAEASIQAKANEEITYESPPSSIKPNKIKSGPVGMR